MSSSADLSVTMTKRRWVLRLLVTVLTALAPPASARRFVHWTNESGRRWSGVTRRLLIVLCLAGLGSFAVSAVAQAAKPTVALVSAKESGIAEGTSATVDAHCPGGYDVLGGSVLIGGSSAFAHIALAAPITDKRLYRATIINPLVNPFAGIPDADASVEVGAICAQSGKPVVVDGSFAHTPNGSGAGKAPGTVKLKFAQETGIENNSVSTVESKCPSGYSVFGGGYAIGGSPWAHASTVQVSSRINAFTTNLVHPPFDPTLGILRQHAGLRVLALCSKTAQPLVLNSRATVATARDSAAPKRKARGNVVLVQRSLGGIGPGSVETTSAKCPGGYSVFSGSYSIADSALAHATTAAVLSLDNEYRAVVTNPPVNPNAGIPRTTASLLVSALCAKNGQPIVIDTPFPHAHTTGAAVPDLWQIPAQYPN